MGANWEVFVPGRVHSAAQVARVDKTGLITFSVGCAELFGGEDSVVPMIDRAEGLIGFKFSGGPRSIPVRRVGPSGNRRAVACKSLVKASGMETGRNYPVTVDPDGTIVVTVGQGGDA